jgi:hypothetical protein
LLSRLDRYLRFIGFLQTYDFWWLISSATATHPIVLVAAVKREAEKDWG